MTDLDLVVNKLSENMMRQDDIKVWVMSSHELLGWKSPAELICQGRTDEVLRLIDQLRTGEYI